MIELTHSLNKKMADRYLYDRYDKFSEENLPSEYFSLDDDSIRVDIPQDETKIKKLMDEVMCLIYMEPDNPYNYHTTYASARGFNSNEIVLEIVGNHSRKIFIYNLTQNEFDLISREKCNEVSFVANMYIICNRGKIGRKYGDFGYILSLLDAGHFIENIKCFSIEEKLSFTLDYNPCTSIDMLRLPKPYQIVPLVKLDITDFFVKKQENLWDNENVNKVKFSDTYTGNKSGSLVDKFIDKVLESKVPIVEKFSNIRTSVKVKELLMRTSSQSAQGYSFFPYECPDDVLDEIIDSVKLSLADVTDDLICVQLVMNTDSVRVYEIKRDHVNTKELNDIDMNSLPHDSLDYVDLKNVSVGVIMYTNCKLYEMNEIWYQYTYIKMGEIAQRISNICGTKELSARPILHTGDGYYPVDVVNGGISEYKFEKWPEFHSNSEALEFYTNKLLEISDEVYFKVYKEKGFNVVRYLIPQVSQIYDDIAYKMRWQGELNDISNLLERTDDITENELKDCIDFISNNCSSASNTIIPFFKHRFSYNSIFKYYNLYLLKFEYYIMCGKLDSVKEIMEKYKNKSNTNKDILSAMTLLIEKIKGDSDNIKEYKMLLSNKLFKIDQLHSDDYCKCNICNCQKIKKAYDKFLIALPKGV